MTVASQLPTLDIAAEKRALHNCVERMRSLILRTDQASSSLRITVGDASLLVDTEQAALARGTLRSPGGKLESLVIRTLGWQAKTKHDLGRVHGESSAAATGRVLFDASCGRLLEAEFDAVFGQGEKFLAARWESALVSLRSAVRGLVAKADFQLDPAAVDELRSRLVERDVWTPETRPVPSSSRSARPTHARVSRQRYWRVCAVAVLLIVAGTASYISMNYSTWMDNAESGTLDASSFSRIPSVLKIEDRPPSILVTVDAVEWTHLDDSSRENVIRQIRQSIQNKGYNGALLYTQSGTVVAQWSAQTGSVFF